MGEDVDGKIELGGLGVEALVDEGGEVLGCFLLGHLRRQGLGQVVHVVLARQLRDSARDHLRQQ